MEESIMTKKEIGNLRVKMVNARLDYLRATSAGKIDLIVNAIKNNETIYEVLDEIKLVDLKGIVERIPEQICEYLKSDDCKNEINQIQEKRRSETDKRKSRRAKNIADMTADNQGNQADTEADKPAEIADDAFGTDEGIDSYTHSVEREETPTW